MEFTEKCLREQEQAFEALKEEFSRLTAHFDGMLKEAGLSADDLKKTLEEKLDPELEKALERAKAEAAQAGRARAIQVEAPAAAQAGSVGRKLPPGAVSI